jgi:hypothetical protein
VQYHHRCSHRQIVYYVGEKDKCEGQEMMQHVLWEVRSLHVKHDCVHKLEAVVGHLEDIEAIHVLWKFLAGMVVEI